MGVGVVLRIIPEEGVWSLEGMALTPPERLKDACENITFPQLRWRMVKMMKK